jgi:benzoylformate decarboxylase
VNWSAEPAIASEAPAVLAHAIHIARTPPAGPVFVSLPMDDMEAELDDTQAADIAVVAARTVSHASALPGPLADDIAARLSNAARPALVVGGDVERAGALEAVVALAERAGAAVWSAPLPGPYLPEGTALIHITSDPDEAARAPVGDAVVADPRTAAQALLARTGDATRAAPAPRPGPAAEAASAIPLTPTALWTAVGQAASGDVLWVSEAGSNETPISQCIRASGAFSHMSAAGGGLGFGLPAAIGPSSPPPTGRSWRSWATALCTTPLPPCGPPPPTGSR